MAATLQGTDFDFPVSFSKYNGKVRDTYDLGELLVIVASDRISAFDHILPRPIPYKGQVLNQTAAHFLTATQDLVPNHVVAVPDPNVTIGLKCELIPVEVVVRGYLAGHAWRVYQSGERMLCGVKMPDGMKEGDKFPTPLITPSTKSMIGHDEDISEEEIIRSEIIDGDEWGLIKYYALELFKKGSEMANNQGLILVDTKYEFGYFNDAITLIDEIHTPDSSRFYYADGYAERQAAGQKQQQLSKEFVREWLMAQGFQGKDGQEMPIMPDEFVEEVSGRYIGVYEQVTGRKFVKRNSPNLAEEIYENTLAALRELGMKG
ncbi:MAG: phosphoribosylaminoimidazolesuccinocarboxamide synthase [Bacteroidia bacterium]|nr:phosphoribosylaminoimidazolesuccinocarboxamide synthase [Bacteroidia bacterium]